MGESSSGRDVESETMVVMVGNSPQGEAGPKLWDTIRLCRLFFPWNCYQRIIKPLKWALGFMDRQRMEFRFVYESLRSMWRGLNVFLSQVKKGLFLIRIGKKWNIFLT